MEKFVEILADKQALIERTLTLVVEKIEAAIGTRGRCTIALAGGSTPKPLYEALSTQALPWDKLEVFWGDERYVPPNHPDSNQLMARKAWLDHVPIPDANIHPMPTDGNDPDSDAKKYHSELGKVFQVPESEFPVFDLILLGMGDDGHTASLFPQTEALKVRDRSITVGNKDGQPRITFTVPLINQARCVMFLVSGASKQPALAQIFAASAEELDYPSRLIQPQGELWWLLDAAAGEKLKR
ncbi:6-phosphogluconolactonase [Gloeothece verrucosa]|uniref:6-phosphogluconolactonase n=1 Tax=Gloeothece verrucosa (strain PCC 7822) TaxID=497965 RepID=E0UIM9_GLOV7|nr:6-phosphogluconolactonase [Gloeothece verrucosa]ADN12223.1 6-phosphogluconolactonase [Gloeothece verrucosa PCC 7822]